MLSALSGMMLDMLAAIARKDYEDRRRRQTQGIKKAKKDGLYRGLDDGKSYNVIQDLLNYSRATITKVSKLKQV